MLNLHSPFLKLLILLAAGQSISAAETRQFQSDDEHARELKRQSARFTQSNKMWQELEPLPYSFVKDVHGVPLSGSDQELQRIYDRIDQSSTRMVPLLVIMNMPEYRTEDEFLSRNLQVRSQQRSEIDKKISVILDDIKSAGYTMQSNQLRMRSIGGPSFRVNSDQRLTELLVNHPHVRRVSEQSYANIVATLTSVRDDINANTVQIGGAIATGSGRTVAIIDSGIKKSRFPTGTVVDEFCSAFIDGSSNCVGGSISTAEPCSSASDNCGHGTEMATMVIRSTSKTGIAPDAKIVSIKASHTSGNNQSFTTNSIIDALTWIDIYHPNIHAVNMSLGSSNLYSSQAACAAFDPDIQDAVTSLHNQGIAIFAATGWNQSGGTGNATSISWPGCLNNVQAVGGTTGANENVIWTQGHNSKVLTKMLAPATSITTTGLSSNTVTVDGTSGSSAIAAGAFLSLHSLLFSSSNSVEKSLTVIELMAGLGVSVTDARASPSYTKTRIDMFPSSSYSQPNPFCQVEFVGCIGTNPQYIFTFDRPLGMPPIPVSWDITQTNGTTGLVLDLFEGITGICLPTGVWKNVNNIFKARMASEIGITECTRVMVPLQCDGSTQPP